MQNLVILSCVLCIYASAKNSKRSYYAWNNWTSLKNITVTGTIFNMAAAQSKIFVSIDKKIYYGYTNSLRKIDSSDDVVKTVALSADGDTYFYSGNSKTRTGGVGVVETNMYSDVSSKIVTSPNNTNLALVIKNKAGYVFCTDDKLANCKAKTFLGSEDHKVNALTYGAGANLFYVINNQDKCVLVTQPATGDKSSYTKQFTTQYSDGVVFFGGKVYNLSATKNGLYSINAASFADGVVMDKNALDRPIIDLVGFSNTGDGYLVALNKDGKLLVSYDNGDNWSSYDMPKKMKKIRAIAADVGNRTLYAVATNDANDEASIWSMQCKWKTDNSSSKAALSLMSMFILIILVAL